jgi:hypothetical protein
MPARRDPEVVKIAMDSGVLAAKLETLRLVVTAEHVLDQLQAHQSDLESFLRERRGKDGS